MAHEGSRSRASRTFPEDPGGEGPGLLSQGPSDGWLQRRCRPIVGL